MIGPNEQILGDCLDSAIAENFEENLALTHHENDKDEGDKHQQDDVKATNKGGVDHVSSPDPAQDQGQRIVAESVSTVSTQPEVSSLPLSASQKPLSKKGKKHSYQQKPHLVR